MSSQASQISRRGFTKLLVGVPLGVVIFDGLSGVSAQPQVARHEISGTKPGKLGTASWKITYEAHYGGNTWAAPVEISYVTGYTKDDSWQRKIGLRNVSAKIIRSIGLGAYIINQDNPSVIVATKALPAIQFKSGFASDAAVDVDAKDNLENMFQPFLKNGVLEGDYRIELFVREVVNDTGVWRYSQKAE